MRSRKLVLVILLVALPVAAAQVALGWLIWRATRPTISADAKLVKRALPGFTIDLPEWKSKDPPRAAFDAWGDAVTLQPDEHVMLRVEWSPSEGTLDEVDEFQTNFAEKLLSDKVRGPLDKKSERRNIAGTPSHSTRYATFGVELRIANWVCNDGRTLMVMMSSKTAPDAARFWSRILDSITCTPETAPKGTVGLFPAVTLPKSFAIDAANDTASVQRWTQAAPVEIVTVTAGTRGDLEAWDRDPSVRGFLVDGFKREAKGKLSIGDEKQTSVTAAEGKRNVYYHEGTVDGDGFRLTSAGFRCADQRTYIAMHYASSDMALGKALDRILAVRCPTSGQP